MDLPTCELLLGPTGRSALVAAADLAPTNATYLTCTDRLRKQFPAELARAALDTILLRVKATSKFTRANEMFFTREALEVSTGEIVSRYRAERYAKYDSVADFCCGIGGDAIGLGLAGVRVHAIDNDPIRVRFAAANLAAYGLADRAKVEVADVLVDALPNVAAAFADPGRRAQGRRFLSPSDYLPPPADIQKRLPAHFPLGFKLAPGTAWSDLHAFDGEVEFISVDGELKECVVWLGPLRTAARRATLLPGRHTLFTDTMPLAGEPVEIGAYIYDPDAAVTRAGLVPVLAEQIAAAPIDHTVQLLTSETLTLTPFATAFRVDAVLKWDSREIGHYLRANNIGRITPIHRGAMPEAEAMVKRVKLAGEEHRFLLLTRGLGNPVVIVVERIIADYSRL